MSHRVRGSAGGWRQSVLAGRSHLIVGRCPRRAFTGRRRRVSRRRRWSTVLLRAGRLDGMPWFAVSICGWSPQTRSDRSVSNGQTLIRCTNWSHAWTGRSMRSMPNSISGPQPWHQAGSDLGSPRRRIEHPCCGQADGGQLRGSPRGSPTSTTKGVGDRAMRGVWKRLSAASQPWATGLRRSPLMGRSMGKVAGVTLQAAPGVR